MQQQLLLLGLYSCFRNASKAVKTLTLLVAGVLQMIKDQMDKKFGSPWHVIVGKAFAYEITYEVRYMPSIIANHVRILANHVCEVLQTQQQGQDSQQSTCTVALRHMPALQCHGGHSCSSSVRNCVFKVKMEGLMLALPPERTQQQHRYQHASTTSQHKAPQLYKLAGRGAALPPSKRKYPC